MLVLFLKCTCRLCHDTIRNTAHNTHITCKHLTNTSIPLGTVDMARVTLIVGLSVFEDEAVCSLEAIGAFLHTVGPVFKVKAFNTVIRTLCVRKKRARGGKGDIKYQQALIITIPHHTHNDHNNQPAQDLWW